ncbi:MAG: adenylate/guanylate cyclase domain-containing protein [Flavobacteriales bacterium]
MAIFLSTNFSILLREAGLGFTRDFIFSNWVGLSIITLLTGVIIFLLVRGRKQKEKIMTFMERRTETIISQSEQIILQKEELEEEHKKSEALLKDVFPTKIAKVLKNKGQITPEYYESASILFADFVSFSKITPNIDAEELVNRLTIYFRAFDKIITENKMILIKTIGDSYFAVGGVPKKSIKNPIYAVLSGLQMQQAVNTINEIDESGWKIRIGINTGEIVAGVLATKRPMFDVWGSSVNVASRLQEACKSGKVNISEETYREIYPYFECEERGVIDTKNIGEIPMYFVKRIKPELASDSAGTIPNKIFWQYANELGAIGPDYVLMMREVVELIKTKLPKNIYYHTEKHALNIMNAVEFLGFGEEIYSEDILLLKTAALFHDVGFIDQYEDNEDIGAKYARDWMPQYGFNTAQIEKVCQLILATKINHAPINILEEIMKDADLDYLGRNDFDDISNKLMREFIENGVVESEEAFNKMQVEFLNSHKFLTDTARSWRVDKKQENIQKAIELYNS